MPFPACAAAAWDLGYAGVIMTISFDVKLQARDLYRFNMYQTYTGIHGWVSIVLAVLCWIMAGATFGKAEVLYTVLYIACGFLFLFYMPGSLWLRANATIRTNEVLAGTLHYDISEDCIRVTQGGESGELPWDLVYKLVSNKKQVLIYSNRVNAYIIPRGQIAEQYDSLCELARKKLEKFRVKLR